MNESDPSSKHASGTVVQAFGNLLHVRFNGSIRQGEVAYVKVGHSQLLAEVIEIASGEAKMQVFEDTRGIKFATPVHFAGHLLEAELGPGLLTSIFDGLQNPLEEVANATGVYLSRGVYIKPLSREKKWDFTPVAKPGDVLSRGETLGFVPEGRFQHLIMVPFSYFGKVKITRVAKAATYTIDTEVAEGVDESGKTVSFTMVQKWPVKNPLFEGRKIKPSRMMDTGLRILDTQFPVLKGGTFCSPGPFGAGKTVMQHHLSKYSAVDIVVIVACGERAGEVVEVLRDVSAPDRSPYERVPDEADGHDLQYLFDAGRRPRSFRLHGGDDRRILSPDGTRCASSSPIRLPAGLRPCARCRAALKRFPAKRHSPPISLPASPLFMRRSGVVETEERPRQAL